MACHICGNDQKNTRYITAELEDVGEVSVCARRFGEMAFSLLEESKNEGATYISTLAENLCRAARPAHESIANHMKQQILAIRSQE